MKQRFNDACTVLCEELFNIVFKIPDSIKDKAQELRLRVNRPAAVICPDGVYYITLGSSCTSSLCDSGMLKITKNELMETFQNICSYSIYSRQNEIRNGFVTMQGGHRAGICGTAVVNDGNITSVRDISSVNIRISSEIIGCSEQIRREIDETDGGILICGAPCSGKTTVLRDLARLISLDGVNTAVIDSRGEIGGTVNGLHQNDIGMADILDGYPRSMGIEQAVRCLSPNLIICDEIGTSDDVNAIMSGVNSGISFIATAHCKSIDELKARTRLRSLFESGFTKAIFLKSRSQAGQIDRVCRAEEILSA